MSLALWCLPAKMSRETRFAYKAWCWLSDSLASSADFSCKPAAPWRPLTYIRLNPLTYMNTCRHIPILLIAWWGGVLPKEVYIKVLMRLSHDWLHIRLRLQRNTFARRFPNLEHANQLLHQWLPRLHLKRCGPLSYEILCLTWASKQSMNRGKFHHLLSSADELFV